MESWLVRLRSELAQLPESGLVHRLDRDTSGCLVVATNAESHADLATRFRNGAGVRKTYLARCRTGIDDIGEVTRYFTSRHKGSAKVTVTSEGDAKHRGSFRWRVLERDAVRGDLIELELVGPGKRHQLRAGCASLSFPLMGDAIYASPSADGLHLHAWRVEIDGVLVEAPQPDWVAAVG